MRRTLGAVGMILACVAGFVIWPIPASAGEIYDVEVTKAVEGEAPAGAEWVIRVDCGPAGVTDLTFTEPGSQVVGADNLATCTVTEIDDAGADAVGYACAVVVPDAVCQDDQTVTFEADGVGEITVTNTYAPEPTTTTTAAVTTTTPAAAVVTSQPAFTG